MKPLGYIYAGLLIKEADKEITAEKLREIIKLLEVEPNEDIISSLVENRDKFYMEFNLFANYIQIEEEIPEPEVEVEEEKEENEPTSIFSLFD